MSVLIRPWGHMHYRDEGSPNLTPIVFANSLGSDLRMWDGVVEQLTAYRRIRFDKRGHGLSATPTSPWTVEDLADDVVALMDHLGLARAVIAGCSIGGIIGQAMGIHHAGRCNALLLSNTAAKIGTSDSWAARIAAIEAGGMASIADMVLERWFAPSYLASPEALPWRTMFLRNDPAGYIGTCRALSLADLRAGLHTIKVPVLMLAGSTDQSTPPALVRETAAQIPGARVALLEGTGHIPAIEAPEVTTQTIAAFLAELADG
jgi:3-oxoadipate enol-lactonase